MEDTQYLKERTEAVRRRASEILAEAHDLAVIDIERCDLLQASLDEISRKPLPPSPSSIDQSLTPAQRAGLVLFFGAVNYCFANPTSRREYHYTTKAGQALRRTRGFYSALVESGLDWNKIDAINSLTVNDWHTILQTEHEEDLYQLNTRLARLKIFSAYLLGQGITEAGLLFKHFPNAGSLLRLLINSGLFQDELLKRAQLTVYMLNPYNKELTGAPIPGLNQFTVMADYRLPQVFYNQGALKITSPELLLKLNNRAIIQPDSPEERALRAGTILLGSRLAKELSMAESDLDHLLWEYSQKLVNEGQLSIPHMLVPTDKY